MPAGREAFFAIALMACGVLLTVMFFVAGALIVVGHFKPSRRMQRAGWIVFSIWALPAAGWFYYLQVVTEHDQYRTLTHPEVVYGVPLPSGTVVSYRRWARRVQSANLRTPFRIQGADYLGLVTFCGQRVCGGTLARDQDVEGLPCRAQADVSYSEGTGRLTGCTLARSFSRQGVAWPAGTELTMASEPGDSYMLPTGADPIHAAGLVIHSGLIIWFTPEGRIRELDRNPSQADADTRLEIGNVVLTSDQYRIGADGTVHGGILARAAVIDDKPMRAGDAVVVRSAAPR